MKTNWYVRLEQVSDNACILYIIHETYIQQTDHAKVDELKLDFHLKDGETILERLKDAIKNAPH